MSHTIHDKKKLLNRIGRIRGQVDAIQRALENEVDPHSVLQTVAACRGAMNGLMCLIIEGHVLHHLIEPHHHPTPDQKQSAEVLLDIIRAYLK